MKWYTYDTEVFAYNFVVVFKDKETGEYAVFHNDNAGVRDFINDESVYCGFNSKGYDQYIIKAIAQGYSPEEVKQVNDWIIGGGQGWECPLLNGVYFKFNNVDIKDDVQRGLSLKAIEGHMFLDIVESDVDFDLDRPLTPEEIEQTIHYCKKDVDATEKLTDIRISYLRTKNNLGKRANIDSVKSLSATNAKLTAMMLGAVKQQWGDGREYVYPPNLDLSVIPKEIINFFDTIHDMSIPDETLFTTYLDITIGGMPCKYAWGGVHGSLICYYEEATDDRVIQNRDVSSLYPSLIELYDYLSRNVPDPQLFYDIRRDRLTAKNNGDKETATDLKTPLNTVSGAQENPYNDLYDPLPTRSMRISGQLFLTMLAMRLLNECKTIKLLNLNTDGLMYSVSKRELPIVDRICAEWEEQTKFELETDNISKVWLKDVNNLLFIDTKGKVKTVGGYLNYGISVKGAWSINNNAIIVKKALVEYFVNGIPVEETINNSTDIFDFQLIAKAGSKYKEAYHIVDGEKVSVQKVNRIYATADERYGKLYKIKAENDQNAKIEMLPEHCIIDNDNKLTINEVDKTFYIELAKKRINDFLGIKPEKKGRKKKMATKKETTTAPTDMNIWQKLLCVRDEFARAEVKRSGKNMQLSSLFYELTDIVPVARPMFNNYRLLPLVTVASGKATMTIVDVDFPEEKLVFELDVQTYDGNKAVTPPQAYGAVVTYYRRHLYMIALDIVEADYLENNITPPEVKETTPVETPKTTIPVAPTTTEKPLASGEAQADELQISQLKKVFGELLKADPTKEEMIAQIAVQTQSFTVISKVQCEALIAKATELVKEVTQ